METPGSSCGNAFAFVKDGGPLGTPTPPAEGGGDGWFSQLSLDPNVANPRNAAIVPSVTTSSRAWNSYPTMPFLPLKSCIHHYVWSFTTTWHCKLQNSSFKKKLTKVFPPDLPCPMLPTKNQSNLGLPATTQVSVVDSGRSNVSQVCVPSPQSIPVTGWPQHTPWQWHFVESPSKSKKKHTTTGMG